MSDDADYDDGDFEVNVAEAKEADNGLSSRRHSHLQLSARYSHPSPLTLQIFRKTGPDATEPLASMQSQAAINGVISWPSVVLPHSEWLILLRDGAEATPHGKIALTATQFFQDAVAAPNNEVSVQLESGTTGYGFAAPPGALTLQLLGIGASTSPRPAAPVLFRPISAALDVAAAPAPPARPAPAWLSVHAVVRNALGAPGTNIRVEMAVNGSRGSQALAPSAWRRLPPAASPPQLSSAVGGASPSPPQALTAPVVGAVVDFGVTQPLVIYYDPSGVAQNDDISLHIRPQGANSFRLGEVTVRLSELFARLVAAQAKGAAAEVELPLESGGLTKSMLDQLEARSSSAGAGAIAVAQPVLALRLLSESAREPAARQTAAGTRALNPTDEARLSRSTTFKITLACRNLAVHASAHDAHAVLALGEQSPDQGLTSTAFSSLGHTEPAPVSRGAATFKSPFVLVHDPRKDRKLQATAHMYTPQAHEPPLQPHDDISRFPSLGETSFSLATFLRCALLHASTASVSAPVPSSGPAPFRPTTLSFPMLSGDVPRLEIDFPEPTDPDYASEIRRCTYQGPLLDVTLTQLDCEEAPTPGSFYDSTVLFRVHARFENLPGHTSLSGNQPCLAAWLLPTADINSPRTGAGSLLDMTEVSRDPDQQRAPAWHKALTLCWDRRLSGGKLRFLAYTVDDSRGAANGAPPVWSQAATQEMWALADVTVDADELYSELCLAYDSQPQNAVPGLQPREVYRDAVPRSNVNAAGAAAKPRLFLSLVTAPPRTALLEAQRVAKKLREYKALSESRLENQVASQAPSSAAQKRNNPTVSRLALQVSCRSLMINDLWPAPGAKKGAKNAVKKDVVLQLWEDTSSRPDRAEAEDFSQPNWDGPQETECLEDNQDPQFERTFTVLHDEATDQLLRVLAFCIDKSTDVDEESGQVVLNERDCMGQAIISVHDMVARAIRAGASGQRKVDYPLLFSLENVSNSVRLKARRSQAMLRIVLSQVTSLSEAEAAAVRQEADLRGQRYRQQQADREAVEQARQERQERLKATVKLQQEEGGRGASRFKQTKSKRDEEARSKYYKTMSAPPKQPVAADKNPYRPDTKTTWEFALKEGILNRNSIPSRPEIAPTEAVDEKDKEAKNKPPVFAKAFKDMNEGELASARLAIEAWRRQRKDEQLAKTKKPDPNIYTFKPKIDPKITLKGKIKPFLTRVEDDIHRRTDWRLVSEQRDPNPYKPKLKPGPLPEHLEDLTLQERMADDLQRRIDNRLVMDQFPVQELDPECTFRPNINREFVLVKHSQQDFLLRATQDTHRRALIDGSRANEMQRRPGTATTAISSEVDAHMAHGSSRNSARSTKRSSVNTADGEAYHIDLPFRHEVRAESSSRLLGISRIEPHHPDGERFGLSDLTTHSQTLARDKARGRLAHIDALVKGRAQLSSGGKSQRDTQEALLSAPPSGASLHTTGGSATDRLLASLNLAAKPKAASSPRAAAFPLSPKAAAATTATAEEKEGAAEPLRRDPLTGAPVPRIDGGTWAAQGRDSTIAAGNALSPRAASTLVYARGSPTHIAGLPAVFTRSEAENAGIGAGFHSVGEVENRYWASERNRVAERTLNEYLLKERGLVVEDEGIGREAERRYMAQLAQAQNVSAPSSRPTSASLHRGIAGASMGRTSMARLTHIAVADSRLASDGLVPGDADANRPPRRDEYSAGVTSLDAPEPPRDTVVRPVPDLEPGVSQVIIPSPRPAPRVVPDPLPDTALYRPRYAALLSPAPTALAAPSHPYGDPQGSDDPDTQSSAVDSISSARTPTARVVYHPPPQYLPPTLSGSQSPVKLRGTPVAQW